MLAAAQNGDNEALRRSLASENVNSKTSYGETAVHLTAVRGNLQGVQALLDKRANPDDGDDYGQTPLAYAAQSGHVDVCKLLLDARANPNKVDQGGYSSLHHACNHKRAEVVRLLLRNGANVNMKNSDGELPAKLASGDAATLQALEGK